MSESKVTKSWPPVEENITNASCGEGGTVIASHGANVGADDGSGVGTGVGYGERQRSARHTRPTQSLASMHIAVSAQPGQPLPPQSTSLSSPFLRPSVQPAGSGVIVGVPVGSEVGGMVGGEVGASAGSAVGNHVGVDVGCVVGTDVGIELRITPHARLKHTTTRRSAREQASR